MTADNSTGDVKLSIVEHLEELRDRIIVVVVALAVSTVFSMFFAETVEKALIALMPPNSKPVAISMIAPLVVYFQVALILGLTLAMPVIIYELVAFLLPALTPKEKRYVYLLIPGGSASFIVGLAFAVGLVLPAAIRFLYGFQGGIIAKQWTIDSYITTVTTLMFWLGIIFELPLIMFFLAKLGVVNSKMLSKFRRFWIVAAAVIAAVVTPTPDPVNMMIVMLPLLLLYEVGGVLVRVAGK